MELAQASSFLAESHRGVLLTLRADGRPQASNIAYSFAGGLVRISVTADRAKTKNLRRDARASLHVTSDDFWRYVVVDGMAELSALAGEPGDATTRALREVYEHVRGEPHPDWHEFDEAMIRDRRLVISIRPSHVYGQLPST
jgi:PPOX class probable F420-dependent enzyme